MWQLSYQCAVKKTSKLVNFHVAILILRMEENTQHFQHIMLYHFKKGKNTTEMQKKICAVHEECAVNDQKCQKWFVKFCAGWYSTVWIGQLKLIEIKLRLQLRTMLYNRGDIQHTQNIQINKVIGEDEKCGKILWKYFLLFLSIKYLDFMEKTKWTLWLTQSFKKTS